MKIPRAQTHSLLACPRVADRGALSMEDFQAMILKDLTVDHSWQGTKLTLVR